MGSHRMGRAVVSKGSSVPLANFFTLPVQSYVMVLTHPDSDHVTGLVPVLERYQVEHESEVYEYWLQLLGAEGAAPASTVLKAAHHGSCSSTTQEFLDAVDPEVVVISVGADNHFGHPCAEVVERLDGFPVYRTDEQGAVEVITDGTRVWVETDR